MSISPATSFRSDEGPGVGVLLVSPNSRLHLELREKVRQPRWNLVEASSGAEALEYLRESVSEILLLDPLLPDLESGEFSSIVSERFPAVQILTINSHTGQLIVGTASPTALSAQLAETLYNKGKAEPIEQNQSAF
jgi:DNA-binding NtrC family response regulator